MEPKSSLASSNLVSELGQLRANGANGANDLRCSLAAAGSARSLRRVAVLLHVKVI